MARELVYTGKMIDAAGIPFLPMMTVYDFFIKRALDLPLSPDEQKVEEDFNRATDKS